jgi:hypothetical protein
LQQGSSAADGSVSRLPNTLTGQSQRAELNRAVSSTEKHYKIRRMLRVVINSSANRVMARVVSRRPLTVEVQVCGIAAKVFSPFRLV